MRVPVELDAERQRVRRTQRLLTARRGGATLLSA